MATAIKQPILNQHLVWEFQFDGIEKITAQTGPVGEKQIEIILSSANKADALVDMCMFTEITENYSRFGFAHIQPGQLILYGKGGYANLLNVLKSAIIPNEKAKVFRYALIQLQG